jgi:hypothetical protein
MPKNPFLVALCLALAIACVSLSLAPPIHEQSPPRENWSDQAKQNQSEQNANEPRYQNYGAWIIHKTLTDPVAAFTALLFVATACLVYIAIVQTRQTQILQRAYLAVEPSGINPFISKDGTSDKLVVGHINIVNVGRLPAIVYVNQASILPADKLLKEEDLLSARGPKVGVLAPGGKMLIGTKNISNDYLGGDGYIFVWGRVDYFKGFGFSFTLKNTKFCHRYPCRAYDLAANGSKSIDAKHARYHECGNDAD